MAVKKTIKTVINEFVAIHGDRYDYTQVVYVNAHTKIKILCGDHGIFLQQPRAHRQGQGCPKCTQSKNWIPKQNLNGFISRANKIHKNKYDYSKVIYTKVSNHVDIICPEHGRFTQKANSHLNGCGCPKCTNNKKKDTKTFIQQAIAKHNNTYDYSCTEYTTANDKVTIICKKHGAFKQKPISHTTGQGCPKCGVKRMKKQLSKPNHDFIDECIEVHHAKYNYSLVEYSSRASNIKIICPIHGVFEQRASEHLRGYGCSKCAGNKLLTTEEFVEKARKIHNNLYDYTSTVYAGSKDMICVICKKHGEVYISASHHLNGGGCNICNISIEQNKLRKFVSKLTSVVSNDRSIIAPYEFDLYVPDHNLAIEYNGNYWHSYCRSESTRERHKHKHKADLAESNNIHLIQLTSHDWSNNKDIVKSMIQHKLGMSTRIGARKCDVKLISNNDAKNLFINSHISGHRSAHISIGLIYNDNLVSAASFSPSNNGWEIIRYATILNTVVVGGLGKLIYKFKKIQQPKFILTFADRRYGTGNGYKRIGFKKCATTRPGYIYLTRNNIPAGSRLKYQKHKLPKILGDQFDPNETEAENMFKAGYRRLWDAGHHKFIMDL